MLTFYLSLLIALGVGVLALAAGNSPLQVLLKAGAALLIFSALGWVLNVILLAAGAPSNAQLSVPQSGDDISSLDDPVTTDQVADSGQAGNEPAE